MSEAFNMDCMDLMARYKDKHFELAIVDPPYGLGKRLSSGGGQHKNMKARLMYEAGPQWDNAVPGPGYFKELFRVSQNQIIWGGNYFALPPTRGIIAWDKKQFMPTFSRWEYAWSSFDCVARMYEGISNQDGRIHPTQKPVQLYSWLLANYARGGGVILDTHLGSGSSRIAAYHAKIPFIGCELDPDYFKAQEKRFKLETAQTSLF